MIDVFSSLISFIFDLCSTDLLFYVLAASVFYSCIFLLKSVVWGK